MQIHYSTCFKIGLTVQEIGFIRDVVDIFRRGVDFCRNGKDEQFYGCVHQLYGMKRCCYHIDIIRNYCPWVEFLEESLLFHKFRL